MKKISAKKQAVLALEAALFYFRGESERGNFIDVDGEYGDISMEGYLQRALDALNGGK